MAISIPKSAPGNSAGEALAVALGREILPIDAFEAEKAAPSDMPNDAAALSEFFRKRAEEAVSAL